MSIENVLSRRQPTLDDDEGQRLRLMALLSLYEALPHSISHPPDREPPLRIDDAIDSNTVRRCMDKIVENQESNPSRPQTTIAQCSHPSSQKYTQPQSEN